jgi:hypothetical protein
MMKLPELLNIARRYFDRDLSPYFVEGAGFQIQLFLQSLDEVRRNELLKQGKNLYNFIEDFFTEFVIESEKKESEPVSKKVKTQTHYELLLNTIYTLHKLKLDYKDLTYRDASHLIRISTKDRFIEAIFSYERHMTSKQEYFEFKNAIYKIEDKSIDELKDMLDAIKMTRRK